MKKKIFKGLGIFIGILALGIAGLLTYVKTALPNVGPAPELKVEGTTEQIERGKYLAHSVAVCMDCHSTRDWSKYSGPLVEGTLGKGGEAFDQRAGLPGAFYSKNITPEGITRYTDGELLRAITSGVTKEGKPLFPIMPHPNYGRTDIEDMKAIIAYIRTLAPIKNEVPESKADFPMNFILNTIPQKPAFVKKPDTSDVLAYGSYLVTMASCEECHTPAEKGKKLPGMNFAGGFKFQMPGGLLIAPNITPSPTTGIGNWTKEQFLARFKAATDSNFTRPVGEKDFNTIMPWTMYANMTESDLSAIYAYLKTVPAVENKIVRWTKN
jgi:mono/diheme cytochrome c family protein